MYLYRENRKKEINYIYMYMYIELRVRGIKMLHKMFLKTL